MRISDGRSDVCSSDLVTDTDTATAANPISTMTTSISRRVKPWARCEIGRASCRESVSVRVDLGGRRIIKTKINHNDAGTRRLTCTRLESHQHTSSKYRKRQRKVK